MDNTRLERIKELLNKLHLGFEYMNNNPNQTEQNQGLIERAQPMIKELQSLGIKELDSGAVLTLGVSVAQLIESYKGKV